MFQEEKRQIVHIFLFLGAFLFRFLERWQAMLLVLFLLLFSLLFLPKTKFKHHLYRPGENKYSQGAILYFLVILVLVTIFPLPVAGAAWAILALGDGTATLLGKNFKCRELPWNSHKTYVGSFSFLFFGTFGAFVVLKWLLPELDSTMIFWASFRATLAAAVVESLPLSLNDNVSVPVVASLVLVFLGIA